MNRDLLERIESLPDLLEQARLLPGDIYENQDRLLADARKARTDCRTTMPYRHRVHCSICGEDEPACLTTVHLFSRNPTIKFELTEMTLHDARTHEGKLPADLVAALSV